MSEHTCAKCHDDFTVEFDMEPTKFCNLCAQTILERLIQMTPEPPKAITWEHGVEILDALQKEIYS